MFLETNILTVRVFEVFSKVTFGVSENHFYIKTAEVRFLLFSLPDCSANHRLQEQV